MQAFKAVWSWLQVVGGVVALVAVCWLTAQWAFHLHFLNVQTGSMRPTFQPGDALIMQQASMGAARVGDVVSYRSSRNPNELITHRVVRVYPETHSFQTQGDALDVADPRVQDSLLAGRVVAILPGMGRVLGWLQSWPGLVVCVYIPAAAIGISELRRFERHYHCAESYRLNKPQVV
jgi:signal peptidase